MTHLGEFSTHRRVGAHVIKELTGRHPAGQTFSAAASIGAAGMRTYLDELRSAGVRLPERLEVVDTDPLTVRHRWVHGPTMLDALDAEPQAFALAIAEIASWVRRLDPLDARIDTNLANFCLWQGKPILIDVLPPLIPSRCPQPETLFDQLFLSLCFDTRVILDAFCGYALRYALRAGNPSVLARLVMVVGELSHESCGGDGLAGRWFRARLRIALRAARGDVRRSLAHEFFMLTSVLGFRQLNELGRRRRVGEVDDRIWELDL